MRVSPPIMRGNLSAVAALLLAGIGTARIVATYHVFTQTFDEPAHIAAGLEWLDDGRYHYDHRHPPLARAAVAAAAHFSGIHCTELELFAEGNHILHSGDRYFHNLALARAGILPFFWIACYFVWAWSRRLFGTTAALLALLLFTNLPPILAHSGLATTDMAGAAFLFGAVYAFARWLEQPTWRAAAFLGLTVALAALTKLSGFLLVPACVLVLVVLYGLAERPSLRAARQAAPKRLATLGLSAVLAFLLIWAGYRFSIGRVVPDDRPDQLIDRVVGNQVRLPAYELVDGLAEVSWQGTRGFDSWLLGEYGTSGWWYFFPVVLAVKTPLAFLLLSAFGLSFLILRWKQTTWRQWAPFGCACAIMGVCIPTTINLGVRHILGIYPFLAVVAGFGACRLLQTARHRRAAVACAVALLGWNSINSVLAHPDYLAYFNEVASGDPEYFLAESDLDWGQDLDRLSEKLQEVGAREVTLAYFGSADLTRHGLPPIKSLQAYKPVTGWVAVSARFRTIVASLTEARFHSSVSPLAWLDAYKPVALVGKSIKLYYIPPPDA
jgi:4-amino-4-deoxy-L-arabinose transferase-like glycosyltransferase